MRVYLTSPELMTDAGKQLLKLTARIAEDGLIEPAEIEELHAWLKDNKENGRIAAIPYLIEMLSRITADGVIDRDELIELYLAIERVIPTVHRVPITQARKRRESVDRDRLRESGQAERVKIQEERGSLDEVYARRSRMRHVFAKVAGVTFPNTDGSERQEIIGRCKVGEQLILRHDVGNEYSSLAIQVLRENGEQLGHAPEYLAEQIHGEIEVGYQAIGVLKNLTGGSRDKPTRGANFVVFFSVRDVTSSELQQYADGVFASEGAGRLRQLNLALLPPVPCSRRPWWKFW